MKGVYVKFRNSIFFVRIPSDHDTAASKGLRAPSLLEVIQSELETLSRVSKEKQKLIFKGGYKLSEFDENTENILRSLVVEESNAVVDLKKVALWCIGSSEAELSDLISSANSAEKYSASRVVNDLHDDHDAVAALRESQAAEIELNKRRKDAFSTPYRFHQIKVLEQFEDRDKAYAILESLATDPGFLAVMRKHKFKVNTLSEMYPSGKAGVDPICTLGLNTNRGQEIQLRIRTDNLLGFCKMYQLRQVLCHELAHNVWGDHDEDFYKLMRQIEKDLVDPKINWRAGVGHRIGGESLPPVPRPAPLSQPQLGGNYILGGEGESLEELGQTERRRVLNAKRIQRLGFDSVFKSSERPTFGADSTAISENIEQVTLSKIDVSSKPSILAKPTEEKLADFVVSLDAFTKSNKPEVTRKALNFFLQLYSRIARNPSEEKYRRIRTTSQSFSRRLGGDILGIDIVLSKGGWKRSSMNPDCLLFGWGDDNDSIVFAEKVLNALKSHLTDSISEHFMNG